MKTSTGCFDYTLKDVTFVVAVAIHRGSLWDEVNITGSMIELHQYMTMNLYSSLRRNMYL